jgi:hypothetical protein
VAISPQALEHVEEIFARIWTNLIARIGGPLTFRLIVQPTVAAFFAIRAGYRDAREGRVPHGWAVLTDSINRRELLRDGWKDIAKVFVAAILIDCLYQMLELRWLHLEEAVIVATLLALLPYLLLRGPANRIARQWRGAEEVV